MQLFLHRANDQAAIELAAILGVGVEIDIRTHRGNPYISHDPIHSSVGLLSLDDYLRIADPRTPILLDFKETGIITQVMECLTDSFHALNRVFAIDLIAPDMYYAHEKGLQTLARRSHYEVIEGYRDEEKSQFDGGWWLDFVKEPADLHQTLYSRTYVVSPELHRWELTDGFITACWQYGFAGVCTDFPERYLKHDRDCNSRG